MTSLSKNLLEKILDNLLNLSPSAKSEISDRVVKRYIIETSQTDFYEKE